MSIRDFYPRSPCGERQHRPSAALAQANFYPRSPCGERQEKNNGHETTPCISIHALLAESDSEVSFLFLQSLPFLSTLSLRRATPIWAIWSLLKRLFLSTLSLRRATLFSSVYLGYMKNFYPRSPCGERRKVSCSR